MHYQVEVNGKTVWSKKTRDKAFDRDVFPAEHRGRPESGEVTLLTDGNVIAVNRPIDAATPEPVDG